MNGIVLFSGINYSGKGTVLNIIQEKICKEGFVDVKFRTLSKLMMEHSNVQNHDELSRMDPSYRNFVRKEVLLEIVEESRHNPVFLDSHFVFEDGEKSDFSILYRDTKLVVLVKPDPEILLERAINDSENISHPGRRSIKDIDFIMKYISEDEKVAREYIENSYELTGHKPDLITISNNVLGLENLKKEVYSIMPKIEGCLLKNNLNPEGMNSRYFRL